MINVEHRSFFSGLRDLLAAHPEVTIVLGYCDELGSCVSVRYAKSIAGVGTQITEYNMEELDAAECKYILDPAYGDDGADDE